MCITFENVDPSDALPYLIQVMSGLGYPDILSVIVMMSIVSLCQFPSTSQSS